MTAKRFLAAVAAATAATFALPPARAAEPPRQIRAALEAPSLVVHLDADGSLVVSQGDTGAGGAITLPSIQALPAEIDALVPRKEDRKKIAVAADPAVTYRNFMTLMIDVREAGFGEVGILESAKELGGVRSELAILVRRGDPDDPMAHPDDKALFVSLGNGGTVNLAVGLGADATVMRVSVASALDAAGGLVPNGRAKIKTFFRADFEVPVGKALELVSKLRAIGFTHFDVVGEATE
jgi:biopolymer transport protein ExbD